MKVIIGGSSSTGSSLLNRCLGRHQEVVISGETSLFARPQLITKWEQHKGRLQNWSKFKPLRSHGWHRENGVVLLNDEWGLTHDELTGLIDSASTYETFIQIMEGSILTTANKSAWIEKTPANALTLPNLSMRLDRAYYITIVRHPLETIASMIHRGYDTLYSCGIFLLNSCFGLSIKSERWRMIRFEDFLEDYRAVTAEIIADVGLNPDLIDWDQSTQKIKLNSWRFAEDQLPQPMKHSRFDGLDIDTQQEVLGLIDCLRINPHFKIAGISAKYLDVRSIAKVTGYDIDHRKSSRSNMDFNNRLRKSLILRTMSMDPVNIFNSPFEIVNS